MFDFDQMCEVVQACHDAEISYRYDYSGRGMYGKTCFAIVGDSEALWDFAVELASASYLTAQAMGCPTTDNMSTEYVYYWKKVQLSDELIGQLEEEFPD